MKTIINVFKNLKTIESKPRRVLIRLSTILLVIEMIWNTFFIIQVMLNILENVDLVKKIPNYTALADSIVYGNDIVFLLFFEPTHYTHFPLIGTVSLLFVICSFTILSKFLSNNTNALNKTTSIIYILSVVLNPIIYSFSLNFIHSIMLVFVYYF